MIAFAIGPPGSGPAQGAEAIAVRCRSNAIVINTRQRGASLRQAGASEVGLMEAVDISTAYRNARLVAIRLGQNVPVVRKAKDGRRRDGATKNPRTANRAG